jgi:hypothetical protein
MLVEQKVKLAKEKIMSSVNRPAIAQATGSGNGKSSDARYNGQYPQVQAAGQGGHVVGRHPVSETAERAGASINTPQTGGVGSQSRNPRGVSGGIPVGGFSNNASAGGGIPGTGNNGEIARSSGSPSAQQTTGTQANPYGKTTPPGESPKDALTKALLQKILNDRKEGEKAVTRNPETKKISEVDREKAQLDEKTRAEAAKLSEVFQNSALELDESINKFRKDFEEQLKETAKKEKAEDVAPAKQLNTILDDLVKSSKEDEDGNKVGKAKYNPQGFMDAAERLDNWIKENPEETKKYDGELEKINDQVQSMKATAQEEIALIENNPGTVLRASDKSAANAADEAGRLKETLDGASEKLSTEDKTKIDGFKTQLDSSMEQINPSEGEKFDIPKSTESLAELKKSFSELPESIRNNPEVEASFKEVADLGRVAVEGQVLARKMEPDSAKYEQAATEYVQGADKLDAAWAEHRTPAERESDIRVTTNDDALIDKTIAEENSKTQEEGAKVPPETSSRENERLHGLWTELSQEGFTAIDEVGQEEASETTRGLDDSIDLDIKDIETDISVDDLIDEITAEADEVEEIEIPEIEIPEIEDLEELDLE